LAWYRASPLKYPVIDGERFKGELKNCEKCKSCPARPSVRKFRIKTYLIVFLYTERSFDEQWKTGI